MEAIIAALSVDGISTGINLVLVAAVGIQLGFVAYRYVKKAANRV
jgi:hypothetical protein